MFVVSDLEQFVKIRQPVLMMKYLACLILVICVGAKPRPQGSAVREVTTMDGRELVNEVETTFSEESLFTMLSKHKENHKIRSINLQRTIFSKSTVTEKFSRITILQIHQLRQQGELQNLLLMKKQPHM